jgi:hypothetical protein
MRMNRLARIAPLFLPVLLTACSVGQGVGAASGLLFEYGCTKSGDYCSDTLDMDSGAPFCGTEKVPVPYDLHPSYFAGDPIDDLREYNASPQQIMNNRLIIRLQRSGKQIELNDVLTFDVINSYEVARCVRGRVYTDTSGTLVNDWDPDDCYRDPSNPDPSAPGRVRIQYDSVVHASISLHATCSANLVASAVSSPVPESYTTTPKPKITDGSWTSWVEFKEFGTASQDRNKAVSGQFHVGLGDRIFASSFKLKLVDDAVVNAAMNNLDTPQAEIGGTLGGDATTGRFDFDLRRGQGAQFFP